MASTYVQPSDCPQPWQLWLKIVLFELTISFLLYVAYAFMFSPILDLVCHPPLLFLSGVLSALSGSIHFPC